MQSAPFLQFQRAKKLDADLIRGRELDFGKNDRDAVRAVSTIQYKNLLFYLLFIVLYNIYNLLFTRLAVITPK